MRLLGLDIGSKRIGVSISDELGLTAQGMDTIVRSKVEDDIEKIRRLVESAAITEIVIGLPLNMDGSEGPQAKMALDFCRRIRQKLAVNVVAWDERLTTRSAERTLIEADLSRGRRKHLRDKLAATIILQSYLDSCSHAPET